MTTATPSAKLSRHASMLENRLQIDPLARANINLFMALADFPSLVMGKYAISPLTAAFAVTCVALVCLGNRVSRWSNAARCANKRGEDHVNGLPAHGEEVSHSWVSKSSRLHPEEIHTIARKSSSSTHSDLRISPSSSLRAPETIGETLTTRYFVIRMLPGTEVKWYLEAFLRANAVESGVVVTAVGSVCDCRMRLADASPEVSNFLVKPEPHEVVSFVGTLSHHAGSHLHISVSDDDGAVFGGHFVEARVHTTLELVIATFPALKFHRIKDAKTGYKELCVASLAC